MVFRVSSNVEICYEISHEEFMVWSLSWSSPEASATISRVRLPGRTTIRIHLWQSSGPINAHPYINHPPVPGNPA